MPNSMLKRDNYAEGSDVKADEERQNKYNSEVLEAIAKDPDNPILKDIVESMSPEERTAAERYEKPTRNKKAEGGSSMLVAPEMGMAVEEEEEQSMPVDTFTPEKQANAEASQLPDDKMEDGYMDYVLGESLDDGEQEYLMGALESDPWLSEIFDKVVTTASEFS